MPKAVLDSTVLVSAFLSNVGVSRKLLYEAQSGKFIICLAEEILEEAGRVLLEYSRIRKRYQYSDEAVADYMELLRVVAQIIIGLPKIKAVVRDPNDDMIIACGVKAKAQYIVSRDKDLLDMKRYEQILIVGSESLAALVRQ